MYKYVVFSFSFYVVCLTFSLLLQNRVMSLIAVKELAMLAIMKVLVNALKVFV